MSPAERDVWLDGWQTDVIGAPWWNNVRDILVYLGVSPTLADSDWMDLADGTVLQALSDGYFRRRGLTVGGSAAELWRVFLAAAPTNGQFTTALRSPWASAEQQGVDEGSVAANASVGMPGGREGVLLQTLLWVTELYHEQVVAGEVDEAIVSQMGDVLCGEALFNVPVALSVVCKPVGRAIEYLAQNAIDGAVDPTQRHFVNNVALVMELGVVMADLVNPLAWLQELPWNAAAEYREDREDALIIVGALVSEFSGLGFIGSLIPAIPPDPFTLVSSYVGDLTDTITGWFTNCLGWSHWPCN